jgi:hypothetical protein
MGTQLLGRRLMVNGDEAVQQTPYSYQLPKGICMQKCVQTQM